MASSRRPLRNRVGNSILSVTNTTNTVTDSQESATPSVTLATRLALHNQDLVDVMAELEPSEDPRAGLAFKMAEKGHIHPLNEKELKELRKEHRGIYAPSEWESPILSGLEQFPFASFPHVQEILTQDIGGENMFRFAPSRGSPEQDANAIVKLLNNIGNPSYCEPGSVIHMQSPTFDHLRSGSPNWNSDGFLGQSAFQMTIAPANEVFELEYNEHYFFSTLLTGSRVWLAFPPRHGNLSILRKAYKAWHINNSLQVSLDTLTKLQHGIAIIQKPGETLLIPPFWSLMVFCTEASTSCAFFIATAAKFMDRIKNMDLWLAVNRLWDTKEDEQAHLVKHATVFANHLDIILKNSFKHCKADQVIVGICREWMKNTQDGTVEKEAQRKAAKVDIQGWALNKTVPGSALEDTAQGDAAVKSLKEKISDLCEAIENREEKQRIEQVCQQAWVGFLDEKRKKKSECRLCHVRIDHMPGEGSPSQRLAQHFSDVHWGSNLL